MKRSEINSLIKKAMQFLGERKFNLPPFAFWTPEEWAQKGKEADEIRSCGLGWDLTDFGSGNFQKIGLLLFTIRNGSKEDSRFTSKTYCEKIMMVKEKQITPMHFHWDKAEDIINRGGGNLCIQLYESDGNEGLSSKPITVSIDGVSKTFNAGETVTLHPGESICLTQRLYHKFWGEKGKGSALVGEVSKVNDDKNDNRFLEQIGRFPKIEEDEPPLYLLSFEYPSPR